MIQGQWLETQGRATFWVQPPSRPSDRAGLVTISDNSPKTDRSNYAAVEVRAAPSG